MRKSEIADLITMARGFDDRIEEVAQPFQDPDGRWIEDARVSAWHLILGDLDYELASRGLAELYREPQMMRLQPGHIHQTAERVRSRNVAQTDPAALTEPDNLVDEDGRSLTPQWRQRAIEAIGRGATIEQAQQEADDALQISRRAIGPGVRRSVLELVPRQMGGTA